MLQSTINEKIYLNEQKNEITGHHSYKKIAGHIKDPDNKRILTEIANDELDHYEKFKEYTNKEVAPNWLNVYLVYFMSIILGFTFAVKMLERGEERSRKRYAKEITDDPKFNQLLLDEEKHEMLLIEMLDEEKLKYVGSIVLGLNDALVELTGALAGYTFAFQNTHIIALTGLITGISASFSMAASEYLSTSQEGEKSEARKSALYTGLAYILTVFVLILPFLLINNPYVSLVVTLVVAVIVIFLFNFYISVAKGTPFRRRFLEMAGISLGVSGISFLIGVLVKTFLGFEL